MAKKIVYIAVFVLLVYLTNAFLFEPEERSPEFVRAVDANPEKFKRILIKDSIQLISNDLSDTTSIFRPMTLKVFDGNIYLSDFTDFSIYEYDLYGNLIGKIKTGRGRGPGEFLNLTDFDVIDKTIWAVDSQNMKISSFSVETGELLTNIPVNRRPMRIACLKNVFIIQWFGTEKLFSIFNYNGEELKQFGEIIEKQRQHIASLDGTLISNYNDRFIYIPFYASLIYYFESDGKLINVIKGPDGIGFPTTKRDGARVWDPDFLYMRDGWIGKQNYLYVYTRLPESRNSEGSNKNVSPGFIDKFNLETGMYVASMEVPFSHSIAKFDPENHVIYSVDRGAQGKSFIHSLNGDINF
ncbi:MAG: 6-bladed beta-propeller [Balneolaceae bacterium]